MDTRWLGALPWFVLLVAPAPARAATVDEAVRRAIAERLGVDLADVELADLTPDPALPHDAEWTVKLPDYAFAAGHVAVTVVSGKHSARLNPTVRLYGALPVVDSETPAGKPVGFHMERRELGELHGGGMVDPTFAWDATVALHKGRVLTAGVVRRHPDLAAGASVTLVAERGAAAVYAPGELLGDALVDSPVRVKNLATKAELRGTFRADGRVHLDGT